MPANRLAQMLKIAGGLALATPALSGCDALCGACGACTAASAPSDENRGCGAATSREAMIDREPAAPEPAD